MEALLEYGTELCSKNKVSMLNQLLKIISDNRYDNFEHWINIGKVIYNCYSSHSEGLTLWKRETELKSKSLIFTNCDDLYKTFSRDNNLSIIVIGIYAKHDNPKLYKVWHEVWCSEAFKSSLTRTNEDVAEAFYRYFWTDLIYYKCKWYLVSNDLTVDSGVTCDIHIHRKFEIFTDIFINLMESLENFSAGSAGFIGTDITNSDLYKVCKLIKSLKTTSFRNSTIKLIKYKFYKENLLENTFKILL